MSRDFVGALLQLNAEKQVPREQLIRTVEEAIQSAYRRVGGRTGETADHVAPAERTNLFGIGLDDGLAEADLTVASNDDAP